MDTQVSWFLEVAVKPGQRDAFTALVGEMVAATRAEPGALTYEWFVAADGSGGAIYECYADPEDASAHYRLGLLLTLSDPDRALTELLSASQLDPQFDPAVQTLRTTINLALLEDSASRRSVVIGRGLGLVSEWRLARIAFEESVRLDADNADA